MSGFEENAQKPV